MENKAMEEKLRTGEALSVLVEGRELRNGVYELKRFVDGKDYCDPRKERWIWSIGQSVFDDKIYAATDTRFYGNPSYSCLFLR